MKPKPVEVVDFDERQFRKESKAIYRAADKFGFVGIKRDGHRRGYLVSAKFWRAGTLGGENFVNITKRGRVVACVVPLVFWELGMSLMGSFAPTARRRLPAIARTAALRDVREAKHLKNDATK